MKQKLLLLFSSLCLVAIVALSFNVITNSRVSQELKKDQAELNHFKYGLFSVNEWKKQIQGIVVSEIDQMAVTRGNEEVLKEHLEDQLTVLIDKIYNRIKDKNLKSGKGVFKQQIIETFFDVKEVKKGVPEYADAMIKELSTPKNERQLKGVIKDKVKSYLKETFDAVASNEKDKVIAKYRAPSSEMAQEKLEDRIAMTFKIISEQSLLLVSLAIVMFALTGLMRGPIHPIQYFVLSLTLLTLLAVGVTTPMIDMEARIPFFGLVLFDHPVQFRDQILFFQSKSIWDVFQVMIRHREVQMKLVGVLLVSFSIVFPLIKMFACLAYYYGRARSSRLVKFFVLKSGKWSMADVLVIAIFMAYIGFTGIIDSQLEKLQDEGKSFELLTTNGTTLQPGYYVFVAYAVLAMFLSTWVKNRSPHPEK